MGIYFYCRLSGILAFRRLDHLNRISRFPTTTNARIANLLSSADVMLMLSLFVLMVKVRIKVAKVLPLKNVKLSVKTIMAIFELALIATGKAALIDSIFIGNQMRIGVVSVGK